MPMGLGIHRPPRVYPLAAHGSVEFCVQWSRVFSHPLGRFQYVQVLRGGVPRRTTTILATFWTLESLWSFAIWKQLDVRLCVLHCLG